MEYQENISKQALQEEEYAIPYHYQDIFAPAQGIERNSVFETIIGLLNVNPTSRVLDIGCGDGRFCYYSKNFCRIEGTDISERALSWARVFNPEVNFYRHTLQSLSCSDQYDGLVCIEVLEHILDEHIPSLLDKARSILKPGGKFILTVPSWNLPLQEKHYRHYDEALLNETLSPYFNVKIYGHSRVTVKRKVMSLLNMLSLLFYSETVRGRHPEFAKFIAAVKKNFWYKHMHSGPPERCLRLIAVCTHK